MNYLWRLKNLYNMGSLILFARLFHSNTIIVVGKMP